MCIEYRVRAVPTLCASSPTGWILSDITVGAGLLGCRLPMALGPFASSQDRGRDVQGACPGNIYSEYLHDEGLVAYQGA